MYLRTTERRNKDGSVVRYLALAHNQRVGATTKANVLLNLGREDRLDPDGLRRLVRSINRYLGEPDAGTDAAESAGADTAADGLRLIASRPVGAACVLSLLCHLRRVSRVRLPPVGHANSAQPATGNWFAELCAISRTSPTFRNLDVTRVRPY